MMRPEMQRLPFAMLSTTDLACSRGERRLFAKVPFIQAGS